ncbi:MAG: tyrosine-type recombinase/integrase [Deltaproteobacteria bacterium]|nr:MAG: tyrosine-type recombinase/integrase [Deltaproteobacteria bacterium]
MQWEQLSFLNPDSLYQSHPFDLRSNDKSEAFSEPIDSSFAHNHVQPINNTAQPGDRQEILERLLEKISQQDLPGKKYVEHYLRYKYRRNCKARTLLSTTGSLMQFLSFFRTSGKRKLEQLSREDLEAFVEDMQDRGLKPETVRTRLCAVYAFVRYGIEQKVLSHELLERKIRLKMPDRLPRAIDPQDVDKLLSVINNTRDRALILLLLRTGMRIGELLNCTVDDVDIQRQKIFIYQSDKTSVGRVVYYSEDAQQALLAWLRVRDPYKEKLFYGQGRQSLCYEAARSMFNKYIHKAGLQYSGYTLHCLRHTFATDLLNVRMPLECLRVLLGHTNLEVTRRYARLTDTTREHEYFKAMERILKGELDCDD